MSQLPSGFSSAGSNQNHLHILLKFTHIWIERLQKNRKNKTWNFHLPVQVTISLSWLNIWNMVWAWRCGATNDLQVMEIPIPIEYTAVEQSRVMERICYAIVISSVKRFDTNTLRVSLTNDLHINSSWHVMLPRECLNCF